MWAMRRVDARTRVDGGEHRPENCAEAPAGFSECGQDGARTGLDGTPPLLFLPLRMLRYNITLKTHAQRPVGLATVRTTRAEANRPDA